MESTTLPPMNLPEIVHPRWYSFRKAIYRKSFLDLTSGDAKYGIESTKARNACE